MEQALTSKNSQFLERWSKAEVVNARLGLALIALTVVCLVLTGGLIYLMTKSRPIYCIPGLTSAGVAYAQENPQATASIFTASWVLNWLNFTPESVEEVYKRSQKFMSPHLLNQTKARLKRDIEQVKNNNISSMFSLNQDPRVEEEEEGFNVTLNGDKGIYMGKEEIRTQKITYHIHLRSISSTDLNPYGLIIEDISQETVL